MITNKNKQILGALALDLKRVALGYYRGSTPMSERFFQEALKRRDEIDRKNLKPYLVKFLNEMENIKKEERKKQQKMHFFTVLFFKTPQRFQNDK